MQLFARVKAAAAKVGPEVPALAANLVGLTGLGAIAFGAWQLSHGLGWIVGGLEAVVLVLMNTPLPKPPTISEPGARGG